MEKFQTPGRHRLLESLWRKKFGVSFPSPANGLRIVYQFEGSRFNGNDGMSLNENLETENCSASDNSGLDCIGRMEVLLLC